MLRRRTAVSYAEGVLTYRQAAKSYSTAIAQGYQIYWINILFIQYIWNYQTENFQVHPSDRLPFPLKLRNHNAVLENHSGRATRPRKKPDDIFSRLDTIPACDGHPPSHLSTARTRCAYICVAHKNVPMKVRN